MFYETNYSNVSPLVTYLQEIDEFSESDQDFIYDNTNLASEIQESENVKSENVVKNSIKKFKSFFSSLLKKLKVLRRIIVTLNKTSKQEHFNCVFEQDLGIVFLTIACIKYPYFRFIDCYQSSSNYILVEESH